MLRCQQDTLPAARRQLRAQVQGAHAQTVRRHPAAVEVHWWRWFFVQDAGVDAGGCGDPATLLAGQSSAAVPVGLPSPGRGAARGRGGGRRVPERRLPNLVKGSQFLVLEVELAVSRSFTPIPSSPSPRPPPHCHFKAWVRFPLWEPHPLPPPWPCAPLRRPVPQAGGSSVKESDPVIRLPRFSVAPGKKPKFLNPPA